MSMSASGGKADIPDTPHQCPLMTQGGHAACPPLYPPRVMGVPPNHCSPKEPRKPRPPVGGFFPA
jgi:hypothetical protein